MFGNNPFGTGFGTNNTIDDPFGTSTTTNNPNPAVEGTNTGIRFSFGGAIGHVFGNSTTQPTPTSFLLSDELEPVQLEEDVEEEVFRFIHLNEKSAFSLEQSTQGYAISNTLQLVAFVSKKNELKLVKLNDIHKKLTEPTYNISYETVPLQLDSTLNLTLEFNGDGKTLIVFSRTAVFLYLFQMENNEVRLSSTLKYVTQSGNFSSGLCYLDSKQRDKLFITESSKIKVLNYSGSVLVTKALSCVEDASVVSSLVGNDKDHLLVVTNTGEVCLVDFEKDKLIAKRKFNQENQQISSLYWFDKNYAIGHDVTRDNPFIGVTTTQTRILFFKLDDEGTLKQVSYSSCFVCDNVDLKSKMYYTYFKQWDILLCGYGGDSKLVLFSKEEDNWKQLNLRYPVDCFPLDHEDKATYPLGIDVDLCYNEKITQGNNSLESYPASPLIHVWTTFGKLCLYSFINTKETNSYQGIPSTNSIIKLIVHNPEHDTPLKLSNPKPFGGTTGGFGGGFRFGNQPTMTANNLFGETTGTTGFFSNITQPTTTFGATTGGFGFGNEQITTPLLRGTTTLAPTNTMFGGGNVDPQAQIFPSFKPVEENHQPTNQKLSYQSLTKMVPYQDRSFEEWRWLYTLASQGKLQEIPFQATQQTPLGQTGTTRFGTNNTNPFGQTNTGGGGFGTNTGGGFNTGGFGTTTNNPNPIGGGTTGGTGFSFGGTTGTTGGTTGGFGGGFGTNTQQQQQTPFGGGTTGFEFGGNQPTMTTNNPFGETTGTTGFFSLTTQPTTTFGASTGGFGVPPNTNQTQQTTNTGFSFIPPRHTTNTTATLSVSNPSGNIQPSNPPVSVGNNTLGPRRTGVLNSNSTTKIETKQETIDDTEEFGNKYYCTLVLSLTELSEELNYKIDKLNTKQTYYELKFENNHRYTTLKEHIAKYVKLVETFDKLNNDLTKSTEELEIMQKVLYSLLDKIKESNNVTILEQVNLLKNEITKEKKNHLEIILKMKRLETKLFIAKLNTYTNYKKQLEMYF
ncbi:hypothetical protein ABK040_003592 [Willaertia magna]